MTNLELEIIWLTLKVALVSSLCTLPFAIGLAWLLARKTFRGKAVLESLITLPLVAPPVVTGYVLLMVLGKNGAIGSWFYHVFGVRLTFNFFALVIASVVVSLPLAVRAIRSAFELINPAYENAAMSLGASRWQTFLRVTLPLAMPGVLSGAVLSFARSLGEFGATITLAGNIVGKTQTISLMVYSNMQVPGMEMHVTRLVMISILISFVALAASEFINRRTRYLMRS